MGLFHSRRLVLILQHHLFFQWGTIVNNRIFCLGSGCGLRSYNVDAPSLDEQNHSGAYGNFTTIAFFQQSNYLWVCTNNAINPLLRFEISSNTISTFASGLPAGKVVRAVYSDGVDLFVAVQQSGVYKWNNSSSKWISINVGLTNLDANCFAHDEKYLYCGTLNGGVFVSADKETWNPLPDLHLYMIGNAL